MLVKCILKPGDGLRFPKKGDYIKADLLVYTVTSKGKIVIYEGAVVTRFRTEESSLVPELEELISEMSMFERCALEISQMNSTK